MNHPPNSAVDRVIDRFVSSRSAQLAAFIWGLGESTFFFLVPDVFLTLLAARKSGPAVKATVSALIGALAGGMLMYEFGSSSPRASESFLELVPGIGMDLIRSVEIQIQQRGLAAVLFGPLQGIPYKIYAVECGAAGLNEMGFFLISIPARYVRFFLGSLGARGLARILERWTRRSAKVELVLFAIFWTSFYIFYFLRFGW